MLVIKAHMGKNKINSEKMAINAINPMGIDGIRVEHKRSQVQSLPEVTIFADFILLFPK